MDPADWYRIQKNWTKLLDGLNWNYIKDDLFSHSLITRTEEQEIDALTTDRAKNKRCLEILKDQPPEKQANWHFCCSLQKVQPHLCVLLEQTVVDLTTWETPCVEDIVRDALLRNYLERPEPSIKANLVRETVEKAMDEHQIMLEWTDQQFSDFVKSVFSKVNYIKGKGKISPHFKNLVKRSTELPPFATPDPQPVSSSQPAPLGNVLSQQVGKMTVAEIQKYLEPIFTDMNIDTSILKEFEKQGINGRVFLSLEKEEVKELFPQLNFGERKLLLLEIGRLKSSDSGSAQQGVVTSQQEQPQSQQDYQQLQQQHQEPLGTTLGDFRQDQAWEAYPDYFRGFKMPVKPAERYVIGRRLKVEPGSRQSLLYPSRRFVLLDPSVENVEEQIALETLPFAAALLNERRNGTIYFGVSPETTEKYQEGQIIGMTVDQKECTGLLTDYIGRAFSGTHENIALGCIQDPKFVPTTTSEATQNPLCVVEIDIEPTSSKVKNEIIVLDSKIFPDKKKRRRKLEYYRLVEGVPKLLTDEEATKLVNERDELIKQRAEEEQKNVPTKDAGNLRAQFTRLFTGGLETLQDDVYPVLMFSPLDNHMDAEYIRQNLSFIRFLYKEASAIFDFDPHGETKGLFSFLEQEEEQSIRRLSTDNFDKTAEENVNNREKFTHFLESLNTSTLKTWVFCNGFESMFKPPMEAPDWITQRSEGFREALRHYNEDIPKDRGLLVIFLFSKNYEVMLEVANEVLAKFPNWMVLAETAAIAELWKEKLAERHRKKSELDEKCVVGMPWHLVSETFRQILRPEVDAICEIPTSSGAFLRLKERDKNSLSDLQILGRHECSNTPTAVNPIEKEAKRKEVEKTFYRGGEAQWWNFWFREDHVLKRDTSSSLKQSVKNALEDKEEGSDKVGKVVLQHQPAAGGTTAAKQVLWDLKDQYRCCVVTNLSDQTSDQIATLRSYGGEENPKPCLVFLDKPDEDKASQLKGELEEKARKWMRHAENPNGQFCVLLVCLSRAKLPVQAGKKNLILEQKLTERERNWFQRKSDTLQRDFKEKDGDPHSDDPKFLLSFNIMKEDFSKDYIKTTVSNILQEITDVRERNLLKYLSLLNAFDADFKSIPLSCFDQLMEPANERRQRTLLTMGSSSRDRGGRRLGWEHNMSPYLKILLNQSSKKVQPLRMTNRLLAQQTLQCIRDESKENLSDIMLQLLGHKIFCGRSNSDRLMTIIMNIVKKRERKANGQKEKFSHFILEVKTTEGVDAVANVMVAVFEVTQDPFLAQQIARFYISACNWTLAVEYASIAVNKNSNSSFFLDTLGQVYKAKVNEKLTQARETNCRIGNDEARTIIELSKKAIEVFQREQAVSERERFGVTNNAGYFNELRVRLLLLNAFPSFSCYSDRDDFHRYLVDPKYSPESMEFLEQEDQNVVKSMHEESSHAFRRLIDRMSQLKEDSNDILEVKKPGENTEDLIGLKASLDTFFGEKSDNMPDNLTPEQACEYRRRLALPLGVSSIGTALRVRFHSDGVVKLTKAINLLGNNIDTPFCKVIDLLSNLNAIVALNDVQPTTAAKVHVDYLRLWSMRLYEMRESEDFIYLECYLYPVLFHFPTPPRVHEQTCKGALVPEIIKQWKLAFCEKYNRHPSSDMWHRRRDTTFFFFGHGKDMEEIVYYEKLAGREARGDKYWRTDDALSRLRRFNGTLMRDGLEILMQVETPDGNKDVISIPTSLPVGNRQLWQRRVFFVLGLSWSGPKAFDVTQDDPSPEAKTVEVTSSGARPKGGRNGGGARNEDNVESMTLDRVLEEIESVMEAIGRLKAVKRPTEKERVQLQSLWEKKARLLKRQEKLLGDSLD